MLEVMATKVIRGGNRCSGQYPRMYLDATAKGSPPREDRQASNRQSDQRGDGQGRGASSPPIEFQNHRRGASSICRGHVAEALVQPQSGVVALHAEAELRDAKSPRL